MASVASAPRRNQAAVIDRDHLRKMTLGNAALEQEVLRLFDKQAEVLLARMRDADPGSLAALAHALKGSARGIGAWPVAAAAEGLERHGPDYGVAIDRLAACVAAVRAEIAEMLA